MLRRKINATPEMVKEYILSILDHPMDDWVSEWRKSQEPGSILRVGLPPCLYTLEGLVLMMPWGVWDVEYRPRLILDQAPKEYVDLVFRSVEDLIRGGKVRLAFQSHGLRDLSSGAEICDHWAFAVYRSDLLPPDWDYSTCV